MLTIIVPSYNEENYIDACLGSIIEQAGLPDNHGVQVIVAANGCKDNTVEISKQFSSTFEGRGFKYLVLNIMEPGKINAINVAESFAEYDIRMFVDADVVLSANIVSEIYELLNCSEARYASGTVVIPRSDSWVTRAYARVWSNLPFVREGVPGIGVYATNAAGRARWGMFPEVYSDDRFVRLNFLPNERMKTKATYLWPLPDGFWNLVKVRTRWSGGNDELAKIYPSLIINDHDRNRTIANLFGLLRTPVSSFFFLLIYAAGKALGRIHNGRAHVRWLRGRV